MISTVLKPIDPFASTGTGGYSDDVVVVDRVDRYARRVAAAVRTPHFEVWSELDRVHVRHRLLPAEVDNDVAGLIVDELFGPGWVSGTDAFERILTGVVLTSAEDAASAWELFYANTLRRLDRPGAGRSGSLHGYAPVYTEAARLLTSGTVLELGCCFGFLSMRLAAAGRAVTASDVTANTVDLLTRVAPRLDLTLDALVCDAARVPRSDQAFDTVLAVHLLEHLEPDHGALVVAEAQRLARRRVVIAVPYEAEPSVAFGHVQVFSSATLTALGQASGGRHRVHGHHGGWLVLDR